MTEITDPEPQEEDEEVGDITNNLRELDFENADIVLDNGDSMIDDYLENTNIVLNNGDIDNNELGLEAV